jgi:hypothetical protein
LKNESTMTGVDVSAAFHAMGQPRSGSYTVTADLWSALAGNEVALPAFARLAVDVISGRLHPMTTTSEGVVWHWVQFPERSRAFLFDGVWVLARLVSGADCAFEIVSEEEVRKHGIAEIERTLLELEKAGRVRRVGRRDGKIIWTAVKPS